MKRRTLRDHLIVLGLLTLLATALLFPYLSGRRPFILLGDQVHQYNAFYTTWKRMLSDFLNRRILPFYSFSSFLGNDWFSSKAYYVTGDILMPLVALFPDVETGLLWIEGWLLIILAGYFFWLFLYAFDPDGDPKVYLCASLLYAFSGTSALSIGQYMFMRAYVLVPLVFLAVEHFRTRGKAAPFLLVSAVQFLNLYYYAFMVSEFLLLYVPFTYYYHGTKLRSRAFLKLLGRLVVTYLSGLLLAGILMVPAALNIVQNPRVGSHDTVSLFFDPRIYLSFLMSFAIQPADVGSSFNYPFHYTSTSHLGVIIYCGALVVPALFGLYRRAKEDRRIRAMFIAELIFLPVLLLPSVNSILHGFSEPSFRFTFLLMFFNCLIFAMVFSRFEENYAMLRSGWRLYLVLYAAAAAVCFLSGIVTWSDHPFHVILMATGLGWLVVYGLLIKSRRKKTALVLSVIEVWTGCVLYSYVHNMNYDFTTPSLDAGIFRYLQDTDSQKFYRIYVDNSQLQPASPMHLNESLIDDYRGVSAYDTTTAGSLSQFLTWIQQTSNLKVIEDPEVLRMLAAEYWCVRSADDLPGGYSFTYVLNNNEYQIYRLDSCRPLAFTYSRLRPLSSVQTGSDGKAIIDWNNELILSDDDYQRLKNEIEDGASVDAQVTSFAEDNDLSLFISVDREQILFLSIPYDRGWSIRDNGEAVEALKVQGGMMGIVLKPGDHTITMHFMPEGLKAATVSSLAGFVLLVVTVWLDHKRTGKESV